jgi:hypothetical protein
LRGTSPASAWCHRETHRRWCTLHPLIGGLPPEIAWPYLETVGENVLPALAG